MVDFRQTLTEKGWRRHSIIGRDNPAFNAILKKLPEIITSQITGNTVIILTTYDCGIVHHSLDAEPWVQMILANPKNKDNNFANGKNVRKLHFDIEKNGESINFETNACLIYQVEREVLLNYEPSTDYFVDSKSSQCINIWIAERFRQDTFPDLFNELIRPAGRNLKKFYKKYNDFLSSVYIKLDDSDAGYNISLILALLDGKKREFHQFVRNNQNKPDLSLAKIETLVANEISSAFKDSVVFTVDKSMENQKAIEIKTESNITLKQVRDYSLFSPYHLSDNDSPLPVDVLPDTKS